MVIEEGKISMDPGKLKGIRDWPTPTTVKQTRGFLGFGNFYRQFIEGFSNLAKPLNDLLKRTTNLNGQIPVNKPLTNSKNDLQKNQS